ncbi:MAG TPA: hypothetical protein VGL42_15100 [Opitutaceae bacterium]|jgi:tetratricopeptide (TPR) repeat protein
MTRIPLRWAIALLAFSPAGRAATEGELGLQAQLRGNSEEALQHYLIALKQDPANAALMEDVARQYSDLSDSQPTLHERRKDAEAAVDYSTRADRAQPNNAVFLTAVAISYGKLSSCSDVSRKVSLSRTIYADASKAVQADPNYAWGHHVLGRWNYAVARVNGTSRMWVKLFYGGLPEASFDAAEKELTRATELEPKEPAHWIELGFIESAEGRTADARKCWQRGLDLPGRQRYQTEYKAQARKALGL